MGADRLLINYLGSEAVLADFHCCLPILQGGFVRLRKLMDEFRKSRINASLELDSLFCILFMLFNAALQHMYFNVCVSDSVIYINKNPLAKGKKVQWKG